MGSINGGSGVTIFFDGTLTVDPLPLALPSPFTAAALVAFVRQYFKKLFGIQKKERKIKHMTLKWIVAGHVILM